MAYTGHGVSTAYKFRMLDVSENSIGANGISRLFESMAKNN